MPTKFHLYTLLGIIKSRKICLAEFQLFKTSEIAVLRQNVCCRKNFTQETRSVRWQHEYSLIQKYKRQPSSVEIQLRIQLLQTKL